MDATEDEDAAALRGKRLDDRFDLAERFAGVELGFDAVFAAEQFEVGDGFETDHLVAAGGVDHEVAGDGEEIGSSRRHILPIFRGIGAGQDFRDHILKLVGGREDAA